MKKQKASGKGWEVGAGVAAGIAGALVAGYLAYESSKPQRKKVKAWVASARRDAATELKKLKQVGAKEYDRLVEKAIKHYGAIQKASSPEIASAVRDAKAEWKRINADAMKMAKAKLAKSASSMKKMAMGKAPRKAARKKRG
jgi:hypothetical protein